MRNVLRLLANTRTQKGLRDVAGNKRFRQEREYGNLTAPMTLDLRPADRSEADECLRVVQRKSCSP